MFYCEFCEISQNTLFHRTPLVAASVNKSVCLDQFVYIAKHIENIDFDKALSQSDILLVLMIQSTFTYM